MKKAFLFSAALAIFCSATPSLTSSPSQPLTEDRCGVTDQQCIDYLVANGYTNVTVSSYENCNTVCGTSNPYHTKVLISGGIIQGYEDLPN